MGDDPRSALGPSVATRALGAGKRPPAGREEAGAARRPRTRSESGGRNPRALPGATEGVSLSAPCSPGDSEGVRSRHFRRLSSGGLFQRLQRTQWARPVLCRRRAGHGRGAGGPLGVLGALLVAPSASRPTHLSTAARPKSLRRFRGPGANGSIKPRAGPCVTAPLTRPGPHAPLASPESLRLRSGLSVPGGDVRLLGTQGRVLRPVVNCLLVRELAHASTCSHLRARVHT